MIPEFIQSRVLNKTTVLSKYFLPKNLYWKDVYILEHYKHFYVPFLHPQNIEYMLNNKNGTYLEELTYFTLRDKETLLSVFPPADQLYLNKNLIWSSNDNPCFGYSIYSSSSNYPPKSIFHKRI